MKKEIRKEKDTAAENASPAAQSDVKEKMSENEGKVGGMLHDARLKKGLKIEDIAKELYIRPAYLEAIESSNYDEIPEPPYGVGFIRTYAEFLGLNSARVVQLFKEETDANAQADDLYVLEPQAEATVPNKKYLLISLAAVALLYAAWFAYNESQNAVVEEPVAEEVLTDVSAPADDFPLQVEDFATLDETVPPADENEIAVVDVLEKRLTMAEQLGATVVINGGKEDTIARCQQFTEDMGADIVFETAGSAVTVKQAPYLVMRGGKIMIVGTVPGDSAINFLKINREVTIQTVFRYANRYPVTIEAISSGRFDVKSMVTHIYDYRDVQQAFEESVNNKRDIIKGVIKISD